MPRTAKKSDTPGIVSLVHKQVFQVFIPKQSHRTPSPEKGAMVVDVGDVEKTKEAEFPSPPIFFF